MQKRVNASLFVIITLKFVPFFIASNIEQNYVLFFNNIVF